MARGQKIDELYISLGLDIARLQLDFDTAGRTVSETVYDRITKKGIPLGHR